MPNIPLYGRRATPTTQNPVREISAGPSIAVGNAISNIGNQLFGMGSEYSAKKQKLREKADIADYETSRKNFETELEVKKNDALTKDGMSYSEVYDSVVLPEMQKFQEKLNARNYSKSTMESINQRWKYDSAGINQREVMNREKMEVLDYTERVKTDAFSDINSGSKELEDVGMKKLEGLESIIGSSKVSQLKSLGLYNRNLNRVNSMNDPSEIIAFSESEEAKTMEPQQYQAFKTVAQNRVSQITKTRIAPAKREISKAIKDGQATPEYIAGFGLPPAEEEFQLSQLNKYTSSYREANQDDIDVAYKAVDKYLSGGVKSSAKGYKDLLKKMADLELPPTIIDEIMEPITSAQERADVNYGFFVNKKNMNMYERTTNDVLVKFREAFDAANAGLPADQKLFGFGNGYQYMSEFIKANKGDIKNGVMPDTLDATIRRAVMPSIERRIDIQRYNNASRILHAPMAEGSQTNKNNGNIHPKELEQLDKFWGSAKEQAMPSFEDQKLFGSKF